MTRQMGMRMAKADEADLAMAQELVGLLDSLADGYFNDDDGTPFDQDDGDLCRRAMQQVLTLLERGSLLRVVWGMTVVCDPRNALIDPDSDVLAPHPDLVRKPSSEAAKEDTAAGGSS